MTKKYISPASQKLNFKFEGVIASCLFIGEGEGDQHYSEGMNNWESVDWFGMDNKVFQWRKPRMRIGKGKHVVIPFSMGVRSPSPWASFIRMVTRSVVGSPLHRDLKAPSAGGHLLIFIL